MRVAIATRVSHAISAGGGKIVFVGAVGTVIALVAGALAVALVVAHFTRDTEWMRDLDERIYASKFGLLFPGGWLYRLGQRHGGEGAVGWTAYDLGRRRSTTPGIEPIGGAPPLPENLARFEEPIPVEPSGRRRAR